MIIWRRLEKNGFQIFPGPENSHQLFLTFQIIISESLGKILWQKIYQKIFGIIKKTVFRKILEVPDFSRKNGRVRFMSL